MAPWPITLSKVAGETLAKFTVILTCKAARETQELDKKPDFWRKHLVMMVHLKSKNAV